MLHWNRNGRLRHRFTRGQFVALQEGLTADKTDLKGIAHDCVALQLGNDKRRAGVFHEEPKQIGQSALCMLQLRPVQIGRVAVCRQ